MYRPKEQELVPHLDLILEGIEGLKGAMNERIKSNDWKAEHIEELVQLQIRLIPLEPELIKLRSENW